MSITLTNGTLVQINGATVENDTVGACMSMHVDYFSQTATFVFRTGTLQNGNLNAGVYGPTVTFVVNLATGAWTASTGATGTIPAGPLATFVSQVKSDRNLAETYGAGAGAFMPGTQVAWT